MKSPYPRIEPSMMSGKEPIHQASSTTGLNLLNFWQWQGSNLIDNAMRGVLAEFLVATALRCADKPRVEWDGYDCLTNEGIKVEIKAGGYIQSWDQSKLSKIQFDIAPKDAWDSKTNKSSGVVKRHADVYVFCVHAHKEQSTIAPLDLNQWEFYVVPTAELNSRLGKQATITIGSLLKNLNPIQAMYDNLHQTVMQAFESNS